MWEVWLLHPIIMFKARRHRNLMQHRIRIVGIASFGFNVCFGIECLDCDKVFLNEDC